MPAITNKADGAAAFALFDTAIGLCAIAWRDDAIVATALPDPIPGRTLSRLLVRCPEAAEAEPPGVARRAIEAIRAILRGERPDCEGIALDLSAASGFERRVYAAARAIPAGRTMTYGELAAEIGDPGAGRAVGAALGANPFPILVPCHRILASGGKSGGFSAPGGTRTKFRLLQIERAGTSADGGLFDHLPLAVAPSSAPSSD